MRPAEQSGGHIVAVGSGAFGKLFLDEGRNGSEEVGELDGFFTDASRFDASWPAGHERNPMPALPGMGFVASQLARRGVTIRADARTVVAGDDDQRVVREPHVFERKNDLTDGPIKEHHQVTARAVFAGALHEGRRQPWSVGR